MTSLVDVSLPVLRRCARPILWSYRTLRAVPAGRVPQWRFVGGKFYMKIDPNDPMDRAFRLGSYEPQLVGLIAAIVRPGDVCLDVGAQKGFMTLHMAKAAGPGGRVIAFEPDPRAMEALESNLHRNGLERVSLYACALADCEARCQFALSRQLGWSSRFPNDLAKPVVATTISVRTRRLDDIVAEMGVEPRTDCLSFIKIDAEGSEPLVLQGAQETLRRFQPTLHIEINRGSLNAGGFSVESVEGFLRSRDYDLYAIRSRRTGALQQRRLCLTPVASLASEIGDCEDVLAVNAPARSRGLPASLQGRRC
jgi:FkbM family methyltransferase